MAPEQSGTASETAGRPPVENLPVPVYYGSYLMDAVLFEAKQAGYLVLFEVPAALFGKTVETAVVLTHGDSHELLYALCIPEEKQVDLLNEEEAPPTAIRFVHSLGAVLAGLNSSRGSTALH